MNLSSNLQRAESYLQLHLTHAGPGSEAREVGLFVTLSREAGAGASTLARLLAERLTAGEESLTGAWRVFDGNLVESMLRKLDIPERVAKYLTEDSTSEIDATIGELVGLHPNLWSLMEKSNCLIRQLAAQGNCILIGRGANYVASLLARGLHVRLVGDPEDRAARMSRLLKVEVKEARARNAKSDAARRRYVRANFGREVDDPMGYDVVVNSSRVGLGEIASMLAGLVAARVPVRSG